MAAPTVKPTKKTNKKGAPPADNEKTAVVGNNTSKPEAGSIVSVNFKVSPEFQREFKTFAAMHGMTMVDLLKESFELYKEHKGH
ncbi:hypothetical protein GZ77_26400 [Endozoicomonas montiporae]|uniref:Uncharacterized protein n=1 Tax=Endozoicomonas montiporae TaxID=1027273 RepID=A0A081MYG1_9GAMM|nr:hypothetical protein [Endozoicomonas montiporae]KEQ11234.1 hypothetical protein GZ77_26400 [Endozoicomonas montiporae]